MPGSRSAIPRLRVEHDGEQAAVLLRRPEVRDVLAWLRLLVEPQDASAVVRALVRPPVELRQVDLARVIQVARRRKLDLVVGLGAATESPHVPPEARERIQRFVELHRGAAAELDQAPPEEFIADLIERLAGPGRPLLAPEDAAERDAAMEALRRLAADFVADRPLAGGRELARHLAASLPAARAAADAERERPAPAEEPAGDPSSEQLADTLARLRADVLASVSRIGSRLAELRLDTDLDISHGVVGFLELLKISAVMQRPEGESLEAALEDINLRLLAAATPLQREILQTSPLDQSLLAGAGEAPAGALAGREEHSLVPFLPRKGVGLALSASDIETYLSCPLRYKFARVLRVPSEQTLNQRFGIAVHQVLERYHSEGATSLERMLELLDAGLRRGGIGSQHEPLRELARDALVRYHARLNEQSASPVWFERPFSFRLGPHHLRGRVDRVDRLVGEGEPGYELIDYKTSRPKPVEALRADVQLSLYALAAREDWKLESSTQAYYYVLDDLKVPVPTPAADAAAVADVVMAVGDGILAQAFEPTPSPAACGLCDYRIACPAADVRAAGAA